MSWPAKVVLRVLMVSKKEGYWTCDVSSQLRRFMSMTTLGQISTFYTLRGESARFVHSQVSRRVVNPVPSVVDLSGGHD